MGFVGSGNIPYHEFRTINDLLRVHQDAHSAKLRALIVFGDLVATGESDNINLLEVVEDWQGPRHVRFGNTKALPLHGYLNIYFLLPNEFERPSFEKLSEEGWSTADLLTEVCRAYDVFRESPPGYAARVLSMLESGLTVVPPSASGNGENEEDPFAFLRNFANIGARALL